MTQLQAACDAYAWPASFLAPAALSGFPYVSGQVVETLDWTTTERALRFMAAGLKGAMDSGDDSLVVRWCAEVLAWGMGPRGASASRYLQNEVSGGAARYLKDICRLADLRSADLSQIHAASVPYMNSGLAKIHSLASDDGLVILDSRVSAALGFSVNAYLRSTGSRSIQPTLRVYRVGVDAESLLRCTVLTILSFRAERERLFMNG